VIATGSMEPADGGHGEGETVAGWRVWRLWNKRLHAIGGSVAWQPGENRAVCLASESHRPPAPSCHCGFWALRNPVSAMQLGRRVDPRLPIGPGVVASNTDSIVAVGLIEGYGAIAVHGSEGYRAELASVACIFSDAPEPPAPEHAELRHAVAAEYGVPCITLEAAISIGFLREIGVARLAVEQLKTWISAGRSQPYGLTLLEMRIARLMLRGQTNAEIARSIGLKSQAVEVHMRRIIEQIGPMRPPPRAA
jgi:hypothetical protein